MFSNDETLGLDGDMGTGMVPVLLLLLLGISLDDIVSLLRARGKKNMNMNINI